MANYLWFFVAAAFEIAGCYAFWVWMRQDKSILWVLPGLVALAVFAFVLTRIEADFAGRAYAAYGGIYIISSLFWLSYIENERLVITDYIGAGLCLIGAVLIFLGPNFSFRVL